MPEARPGRPARPVRPAATPLVPPATRANPSRRSDVPTRPLHTHTLTPHLCSALCTAKEDPICYRPLRIQSLVNISLLCSRGYQIRKKKSLPVFFLFNVKPGDKPCGFLSMYYPTYMIVHVWMLIYSNLGGFSIPNDKKSRYSSVATISPISYRETFDYLHSENPRERFSLKNRRIERCVSRLSTRLCKQNGKILQPLSHTSRV